MIPQSLRKRQRAFSLSIQKAVLKNILSKEDERELKKLEKYFNKESNRNLRRLFAQIEARKAYQKKTKNINCGQY